MPGQVSTVQGLLQEASQLSPEEQLQLAIQLLQRLQPVSYRQLEKTEPTQHSSNNYRTMINLAATNPVVVNLERNSSTKIDSKNTNADKPEITISYLLDNPIPVHNDFKPLSREEIYD
ncbi:hypothetical protein [Phormidium sp. FACHB-1136]|uniref:hypothetical protein n=1 Tax=Phormidium sp. FACHB-1136 TaxID=2692848 RepID=UPI00168535DA|nr:hypothetical protein [Phormidium sp. FACHB-1136]MBD2425331.1 hypothetical protein [Phormidium sp. FACHB-1136]